MPKKKNTQKFTVKGKVSDALNHPVIGFTVEAYYKNLRTEKLLGKCKTDGNGEYEITYAPSPKNSQKSSVDITIKVYTPIKKTQVFESELNDMVFNASENQEINIVLKNQISVEENEFDFFISKLKHIIGKIRISDLLENDEHKDVTFISRELNTSKEKIEHLIIAHRLSDKSTLDSELFYALLRSNLLNTNYITKSFFSLYPIDLNTNLQYLLYNASLLDTKLVNTEILRSVKELVISDDVLKKLDGKLKVLNGFKKDAETYFKNNFFYNAAKLIGTVIFPDIKEKLSDSRNEINSNVNSLLQEINDDSVVSDNDENITRTNISMAFLLGINDDIINKSIEIKNKDNQINDVKYELKKLAAMNKPDWKKFLIDNQTELDLNSQHINEEVIENLSSLLARKLEMRFPSVAFVAYFNRKKPSYLKENDYEVIKDFFDKNKDFDLFKANLDLFLNDNLVKDNEENILRSNLAKFQRVLRLTHAAKNTDALIENNIQSARCVTSVSKDIFVNDIAVKADILKKDAIDIYNKSKKINDATIHVFGNLQELLRTPDIPALFNTNSNSTESLVELSNKYPSLKFLFDMADNCSCEHSMSLYSPASYFVELLQYLGKIEVGSSTKVKEKETITVKDILIKRRSDLVDIDLNSNNSNTLIPYIDLVCEILESRISIDYTGYLAKSSMNEGKISEGLVIAFKENGFNLSENTNISKIDPNSDLSYYLEDTNSDKDTNNEINVFFKILFVNGNEGNTNWEIYPVIRFTGYLAKNLSHKGEISKELHQALTKNRENNFSITENAKVYETETKYNPGETSSTTDPSKLNHFLRDTKIVCKIVYVNGEKEKSNWEVYQLPQTFSSEKELSASPDYLNNFAYQVLKNKKYAFSLPFNLYHVEATEYFKQFGVSRSALMNDFQYINDEKETPADIDIQAEILGLTFIEKNIILNKDPENQHIYWGLDKKDVILKMQNVETFLNKTGLLYAELELLLSLEFIDPGHTLIIKNIKQTDLSYQTDPCDTSKKIIENLDVEALDRIHRFLRLQKKTGWNLEILNEIIIQSKDKEINENCLMQSAILKTIEEVSGIELNELLCCFGKIPNTDHPHVVSNSYDLIFQNKSKNGFVDKGLDSKNIDGTKNLEEFKTSLSVCFGISESDFDIILNSLKNNKPTEVEAEIKLSFQNLSSIYLLVIISKKMNISIQDVLNLNALSGIFYYEEGSSFDQNKINPESLLDFIKIIMESRSYPFSPEDLRFFLRHDGNNIENRELDKSKIKSFLDNLIKEYQELEELEKKNPLYDEKADDNELKTMLIQFLSKLAIPDSFKPLSQEDINKLVGFIDTKIDISKASDDIMKDINDTKKAIDETKDTIDKVLNKINKLETEDILKKLKLLEKILEDPKKNSYENAKKEAIKSFLKALSDYFLYELKLNALIKNLTLGFKFTEQQTKIILLTSKLRNPPPPDKEDPPQLVDILMNLPNIDLKEEDYDKQYASLRLLHKMMPLINSFGLKDSEFKWFMNNNEALKWFMFDGIPYESTKTPVDLKSLSSFFKFVSISKHLTPVINAADAENPVTFFSVLGMLLKYKSEGDKNKEDWNEEERKKFLIALSALTGYEYQVLDSIDNFNFSKDQEYQPSNLKKYFRIETWEKIQTCSEHLRKMGITIEQIKQLIKPELSHKETELLRMALKVHYDENMWLSILKEIMNRIRLQKRDALVTFLLNTKSQFENENDLYDHYLVDVKMQSCMPTSRIVQSQNSIQLFVQRCLMGLEEAVKVKKEEEQKWDQWKWMKNYRVWEANRKVFLYPENWIEPELRDDKSELFKELENELSQNELNNKNSEKALKNFLYKLNDISFLEVVATWVEDNKEENKTLHVFARTKTGNPPNYYYRKFQYEFESWTSWEKINLEISSDILLAFSHNDQMFLTWPILKEEKRKDNENKKNGLEYIDIYLAMSNYEDGAWKPKKISKEYVSFKKGDVEGKEFGLFHIKETNPQKTIIIVGYIDGNIEIKKNGCFELIEGKRYFERFNCQGEFKLSPYFTNVKSNEQSIEKSLSFIGQRFFYISNNSNSGNNIIKLYYLDHENTLSYFTIFNSARYSYTITYPMQIVSSHINYDYPFFIEDGRISYIVITPKKLKSFQIFPTQRFLMSRLIHLESQSSINLKDHESKLYELQNKTINFLFENNEPIVNNKNVRVMYHPYIDKLISETNISKLMDYDTQKNEEINNKEKICKALTEEDEKNKIAVNESKFCTYSPNTSVKPHIESPYPVENIDFDGGSYSSYNWELFFHIPFIIAGRLSKNQRFEDAMNWFHFIFNPTGISGSDSESPKKYWVTKPFHDMENYKNELIHNILKKLRLDPNNNERTKVEREIEKWRNDPFNPFVLARSRKVAFQKAVLMKYLDNLIEWGDYLFRQDTTESIVQATQKFVLASKLLGSKPRTIPNSGKFEYENFYQIEKKLDSFGNALMKLENFFDEDLFSFAENSNTSAADPADIQVGFYFCIPQNENLLKYWDLVEDRLFKIRNCQNIDGIERNLSLFTPPIDPGLLVRARAAGLDIDTVISNLNAPTPHYRFNVHLQKAVELTQELKGFGSLLLQIMEKKDTEEMSLLRSNLDTSLLKTVRDVKILQIDEAKQQIKVLKKLKAITEEKFLHYSNIQKISPFEQINIQKLDESQRWQIQANETQILGSTLALIPDYTIAGGTCSWSGITFGGTFLSKFVEISAKNYQILSSISSYQANRASILGGYERRFEDWKLQERLAQKELVQIDKQIIAAEIRLDISLSELKNHDSQIENSQKIEEFLKEKFTNKELYEWMLGQMSSAYFKVYQLAFDYAKKAERCFQYELGVDENVINNNYWDSLKKGLLSGESLMYDIKRLESKYLEKNKRDFELSKHISLSLLDPFALELLRKNGVCEFKIPEVLFDMDHPGNYFRRIKAVSISIPCISGPYSSISCKLTLLENEYRKLNTFAKVVGNDSIYKKQGENDDRFVKNTGGIQSISTSSAQNDFGIFEMNFRDERYLPFEGCGTDSRWRIELPDRVRQFDYDTISDVVLHMKYTSRDGGKNYREKAEDFIDDMLSSISKEIDNNDKGLSLIINVKRDIPNIWKDLKNCKGDEFKVNNKLNKDIFPYFIQLLDIEIKTIYLMIKTDVKPTDPDKDNKNGDFMIEDEGISFKQEGYIYYGTYKVPNNKTDKTDRTINIFHFNLSVSKNQIDNLKELSFIYTYNVKLKK